jgi:hypothetical protein
MFLDCLWGMRRDGYVCALGNGELPSSSCQGQLDDTGLYAQRHPQTASDHPNSVKQEASVPSLVKLAGKCGAWSDALSLYSRAIWVLDHYLNSSLFFMFPPSVLEYYILT